MPNEDISNSELQNASKFHVQSIDEERSVRSAVVFVPAA